MSGEVFVRQYSDNQNVIDMANAACRAVLGCDMAQVSALYFVAYAASAGSLMRVLLADPNTGLRRNLALGEPCPPPEPPSSEFLSTDAVSQVEDH